ncbi:phosphate transport system permease protein PstA [Salinibacterium xinjiangense]|uniref:Phosphate transport system permease protein PstA n=2 Tax=Salinibacterium xinjiangense TaxID=386302 RepID=A0A2C8YAK9_9MICO|nr:phosphate transport system permease protein PstA [Salinibacterium xinjiangense]SOE47281.1 phosphate ABC transporter membrane protein 2, PhoT family [Salinibacterium xinjiangense]
MSTTEQTEAPTALAPAHVAPPVSSPRTWIRDAAMATPPGAAEARRSTATVRTVDVIRMLGSAAAAVGLTAWLYFFALPLQGQLGFVLISYLIFLILFAILTSFDENRITVKDRLIAVFIQSLAFILLLALFSVVIYTFGRGLAPLGNLNFFIEDMSNAGPLEPLTQGGVLHAVVGTLIMITIALAISIPLGLLTAVFLSEFPGRYASFVRTIVEAMTALPSIVAGLFIYATLIVFLGFNRSGFAASLAITVMMLPIIIRSADVVLRLVPGNLKEASRALGASTWRTVWNVTLPTARSGLTTAIILGTARGIGETSPVLLTAGATTFLNLNPFNGPMTSLPLTTFTFVKSPELTMVARGFGTAAVLMVLVLILFALARAIGGRGAGQLSVRQQRARTRQSRDDDYRYRRRELGLDRNGGGASRGSLRARLGIGHPLPPRESPATPTRKDTKS